MAAFTRDYQLAPCSHVKRGQVRGHHSWPAASTASGADNATRLNAK